MKRIVRIVPAPLMVRTTCRDFGGRGDPRLLLILLVAALQVGLAGRQGEQDLVDAEGGWAKVGSQVEKADREAELRKVNRLWEQNANGTPRAEQSANAASRAEQNATEHASREGEAVNKAYTVDLGTGVAKEVEEDAEEGAEAVAEGVGLNQTLQGKAARPAGRRGKKRARTTRTLEEVAREMEDADEDTLPPKEKEAHGAEPGKSLE